MFDARMNKAAAVAAAATTVVGGVPGCGYLESRVSVW